MNEDEQVEIEELVKRIFRLEKAVFGFEDNMTDAEMYFEDFRERCRRRRGEKE